MQVTPETTAEDLLETYPGIAEVFEAHGVDVEHECDAVMYWPLKDCVGMCDIEDLDKLIADLNEWIRKADGANK